MTQQEIDVVTTAVADIVAKQEIAMQAKVTALEKRLKAAEDYMKMEKPTNTPPMNTGPARNSPVDFYG